ncbi:hypothetical protein PACTADRAFT_50361 [Pachysolen tannophilus NRRL Y-2460]|uniref:BHLH domain-containing protein n=1 Tax=Pachysolen tannophilus NRRL Y-2460 TaxID=669874 RepID=A0A1E4TVB8_PACTA|nr:hypothetical protein PACTADRAFT_50361 [Pachysolen tannophilus NRRL Y-2460]
MTDNNNTDNNTNKKQFLSEDVKKHNHNESEQRRREQLRSTYDKLVELIPSLSFEESRSELAILNKSVNYIKQLRKEHDELLQKSKEKGIDVESLLK